jgi:hypothetical protein
MQLNFDSPTPVFQGQLIIYGFALLLLGHICTCDLEVLFDVVDTNVTCGAFGFLILSYNY